jgi:hypothetical protein
MFPALVFLAPLVCAPCSVEAFVSAHASQRARGASRGLCAALFLAAVAAPGVAHAADFSDELGRYDRRQRLTESPQEVAVEFRFGRYVPNADEGVNGTPYADTFGTDNRYYGGLELDWQLLRIPYLGTLGPGFGIGYTKASAKALTETGLVSGQPTALQILPMYLVGVLRADVIPKETAIPLVPYAKAGLGFAFWRASDADDSARVNGVVGRGHSYGPQFALGCMLLMDVFDPSDARTADANIGLNHSYLFGEWFVSKLDGFGSGDQLQVGTNTWTVGLAFEF